MVCRICNRGYTSQSKSLVDGSFVHESCITKLEHQYESLQKEKSDSVGKFKRLKSAFRDYNNFTNRLKRVILRRPADGDSLKYDLKIAYTQARKTISDQSAVRAKLKAIYDFWPTYPPDWQDRRALIRERDGVCTVCGRSIGTDAHHIKPLAKGGTNKPDNLVWLCRPCHENMHKRPISDPGIPGKNPPSLFEQRIEIINKAIAGNRTIQFQYKKRTDSHYLQRTVSPQKLEAKDHTIGSNFTLCVRGYCHLRSASRTFALDDRMKGLKII